MKTKGKSKGKRRPPQHDKKFWGVVAVAMVLPAVFALLDLLGAHMWGTLGGWAGKAYITAQGPYMLLFWSFAYLMIAAIAITYWIVKRDKSEALALGIIPFVLLQFGVEDVFFYLFGNIPMWADTMPWLTENLWAPTLLGRAFGHSVITGPVLFVSALIGIALSFWIGDYLYRKKW